MLKEIMKLVEDLRSVIDRLKELDRNLAFNDKDNNSSLREYGLSALTILSRELDLAIDEIWENNKLVNTELVNTECTHSDKETTYETKIN